MKKLLIAASVASAFAAPAAALAADAAPASPYTFTANVSLVSDYRFRGISQTFNQSAIQGGFDLSHSSGLYAGIWSSNVYGNQAALGNPVYAGGSQEIDLYGGYKWTMGDFGLDVGFLQYYYPNAKWVVPSGEKFNNQEIYGDVTWKWFTLKYSYGITNFFGLNANTDNPGGVLNCGVAKSVGGGYTAANAPNGCMAANGGSRGSGYIDLSGTWELMPTVNLQAHIGHQTVSNYGKFNYTDWKLGVTKDWAGVTWGLTAIGTDAKKPFYTLLEADANGNITEKKTGDTTLVLSVSKTF